MKDKAIAGTEMTNVLQKEVEPLHVHLLSGNSREEFLQRVLERYAHEHEALRLHARAFRTVLDERALIVSTHAAASITAEFAHYAVHLNANEVACMGGEPKRFMTTVLLPEHESDEKTITDIFDQIRRACRALNVTWHGVNVERTSAVTQPMVTGTMLGEAPRTRRYEAAQIRPGDAVLLTKGLAIAGTAMIAARHAKVLAEAFDEEFAQQCRGFSHTPGLSVLPEARMAWNISGVHALCAPAEGGVAHALHEVLAENNLGVEIDVEKLPLLPETKLLCEHFGLDPLGLAATGAMLLIGEAAACEHALREFETANIPAAVIGQILPEGEGRWVIEDRERKHLPAFSRDEVLRLETHAVMSHLIVHTQ